MAKIYTRLGDDGRTMLIGGEHVDKDHLRVEAFGALDELNALLGCVRAELTESGDPAGMDPLLARVQHQLFDLGSEIATPQAAPGGPPQLEMEQVAALEAEIDRHEAELAPLRVFILPGGCPAAALLHLARCVCRRSERQLVTLSKVQEQRGPVLAYLNRLSDLLFVLARRANQTAGVPDVEWQKGE